MSSDGTRKISKDKEAKLLTENLAHNIIGENNPKSSGRADSDLKRTNQTVKSPFGSAKLSKEKANYDEVTTESDDEPVGKLLSLVDPKAFWQLFPFVANEGEKHSPRNMNHSIEGSTIPSDAIHVQTVQRVKLAVTKTKLAPSMSNSTESPVSFSKKIPMLLFFYTFTIIIGVFESAGYSHASVMWYSFLDDSDEIEDFEIHRWVSLLLASIVTFILGIVIVQSPCRIPPSIDWFQLNVLFYSVCIVIAGILFICFSRLIKTKAITACPSTYMKRVLNLFVGDNITVVAVTVLLSAMWSASLQDFLLWTVEDLGGNGYHFGATVALGLISEMMAPSLARALSDKLHIHKCLILLNFFQAIQLFCLSFVRAPGLLIVGQMASGCFIAIRRIAFEIVMKQTHPALNFQAQTTINVLLGGLGFTVGSITSGIIYHYVDGKAVYQYEGFVALVWSLILLILSHFRVKSPQDTYEELQTQDPIDRAAALSVVESDSDDDWLEEALKKNALKQKAKVRFSIQSPDLRPAED